MYGLLLIQMTEQMNRCALNLTRHLLEKAKTGEEIELKE